MNNQQKLKRLRGLLEEIEVYRRAIGKLQFDQECCAPPEGLAQAGEDMAVLGLRLHRLTHSPRYIRLICELHDDSEGLTPVQKRMIDCKYREYSRTKNISDAFAYEIEAVKGRAYGKWLEAKKANDYSIFRDSLADVVRVTRREMELRDERKATLYDACLDDCERGGSQARLDEFFSALRNRIVPLTRRILREGKAIREDFLSRPCPISMQEAFSKWLLRIEGLRETALVLMTTEHPFTESFGPKDVRVTTHYYENNFISNIFSTLHEGGHALFMQNEPEEFFREYADNNMSNAMHECVSRFYENYIGRSEAFIRFIYPKLKADMAELMQDVSERELYEGVNLARPSLIRTDADELTYCLHILVRYEIEKALINGEITADAVPAIWNEKYGEVLGVDVSGDAEGCLQDVHWTFSFGYFPSYALGNAYGAQILRRMKRDFDVDAAVESGDLIRVREWMKAHVFSRASMLDPDAWIREITGEPLDPEYYLDYLEEKYTRLYGLK